MHTSFDISLASQYKSNSQKVRVLTEGWVAKEVFCPSCGNFISKYENNRPVADFYCSNCMEEYELKSKKDSIVNKIVDGSYKKMIERLEKSNSPNLFLLNYSPGRFEVQNFFVVPKYFFVPDIIEKRKPLSPNARRAGWIGCNIVLRNIPLSGKIFYLRNKHVESKRNVLKNWQKVSFLKDEVKINAKGWILDIMNCIERLNKKEFTLNEMYTFENLLAQKYTNNKHIKDKIRQQLQFLRNKNYLEFLGKGKYKIV